MIKHAKKDLFYFGLSICLLVVFAFIVFCFIWQFVHYHSIENMLLFLIILYILSITGIVVKSRNHIKQYKIFGFFVLVLLLLYIGNTRMFRNAVNRHIDEYMKIENVNKFISNVKEIKGYVGRK